MSKPFLLVVAIATAISVTGCNRGDEPGSHLTETTAKALSGAAGAPVKATVPKAGSSSKPGGAGFSLNPHADPDKFAPGTAP